MRIVGLISGGKDSIYNMLQCIAAGHEVVAVANIEPLASTNDLDSYMYQTVGHQILSLVSGALALPIFRQRTKAIAVCKEKIYIETADDEVEDLFTLLSKVKNEMHIDGVAAGAIASDYQRTRVENVCMRLGLKCYTYLWMRDQEELLQEMIDADINAIIIKVAALGLKPENHLGISIKDAQPVLLELHEKFGVHICGEGGEYETLTVDCPLYHRKINLIHSEKVTQSDDALAPVGYLNIKKANLEKKSWSNEEPVPSVPSKVEYIRSIVKPPLHYVQDCLDDDNCQGNLTISTSIPPEVLPFLFGSSAKAMTSESDQRTVMEEYRRSKSNSSAGMQQVSRVVTFSPSSLNVDTAMVQLNHSTGWCCIGNVTAPSIKEGLTIIRKHLDIYQYDVRDIVSVYLYVRDMSEWSKMNKIYSQYIPNYSPPVRCCVGIPLPDDVAVITTVTAHRLVSKTQKVVHHTQHTVDRDILHVQSISHWAPANIGPYSQSVRIGEIVYVAGQIPLIPGSMELLNGTILQQCKLALRHVCRIVKAVNESYTMSNIMHGICYVTSEDVSGIINDLWNYITNNEHAAVATVVVQSLPKNSHLEWQVLACGYERPQVSYTADAVADDIFINCKRCFYYDHHASAVVCNVSYGKKNAKRDKILKSFTPENISSIMKYCIRNLRSDLLGLGTPLCMFTVFYRATDTVVASVVNDTFRTSYDFKVVVSCVPVVACCESDIFLTITGVCH